MSSYRDRLNRLSNEVTKAIFEKDVDFTKIFEGEDWYTDDYDGRVKFIRGEWLLDELPMIDFRHPFSGDVISVYVLKIEDKFIHVLNMNNYTEIMDISDVASVDELVTLLEFI